MKGTLYGVGIGPGDPELLTLKAVRIIKESAVIAVPGKKREDTVAYQIVKQIISNLDQKEFLEVEMPMTKEKNLLEKSHREGAERICRILENGRDVAFLTLGDPTIYSTYLYLHKQILKKGYSAKIINGIPSFCAAAARLNTGLVEKSEPLHVIPASYPAEDALKLTGTRVLMKAGKNMANIKWLLKQDKKECKNECDNNCSNECSSECDNECSSGSHEWEVMMVENCGMPGEKISYGIDEINEKAGYYSLIIIKEKKEKDHD